MISRWYDRLTVHTKLVVMALAITSLVSALTVVGTAVVDTWRYRTTAVEDTRAFAGVMAENVAAAVVFEDPQEANTILAAAAVRPTIRHACLYLPDGRLFAQFARIGETCPARPEAPSEWLRVGGHADILRNQNIIGTVHVDRDLPELVSAVWMTGATGVAMILLGAMLAVPLAHRLHLRISEPIAQLAAALRDLPPDASVSSLPPIDARVSEVSDLVRAFSGLLARISHANTEREELLRREQEASRLKDEFLAAVSHELRTPLNAMVGWIHILARTSPDPDITAKAIDSIARNARTQTRVIEDLIDVSRIVSGKLDLRLAPVDLRQVIETSVDLCRASADAKPLSLTMAVPDHPCFVSGDRDRLQQVVGNLLSNAVKFTAAGGTVRVVLTGSAVEYEITVSDNGVGMRAEFIPVAFDRFRQADGSTTRRYGGLGLGLAIVRELTTLHGGHVTADSPGLGLGATFRVRLPALLGSYDDATTPETESAFVSPRSLAGIRVLAVDDNTDALDMLAHALQDAGAEVQAATSGAAALALAERWRPDVLLCDLAMPDMDGFEVLRRIHGRCRPGDRRYPAIALSAHASDDYRRKSLQAGFHEHVAKPFSPPLLFEAIRRLHGLSEGTGAATAPSPAHPAATQDVRRSHD